MLKLVFFISLVNLTVLNAQTQFQRIIAGPIEDFGYSIIQTTDGGYAVAGKTVWVGGNTDIYIIKLNSSGNMQWNKTIGGTANESGSSIIQTTDGGYVVAGSTISFSAGQLDIYIVKFDYNGNIQWNKSIGGTGTDGASSIAQTTDDGYIIAGTTNSFGAGGYDFYIVKLNAAGSLQWCRTVGGAAYDLAHSIIQTTDGGYAVAGASSGNVCIVKLDANGSLQWNKSVGGPSVDEGYSVIQTSDGGYAAAGMTGSFPLGDYNYYIVKFDSSGTVQWTRTVGGALADFGSSLIQTTDGGYAMTGWADSFSGGMYVVKLTPEGIFQWGKSIGASSQGECIIQTTDGGFAVVGRSSPSDIYVVKLDANGNTCGNFTSPTAISGSGGTVTSPSLIVTNPSPTVTAPVPTTSTSGALTSVCTFVGLSNISNNIPQKHELCQNFPNPFNPNTKIKFQLPHGGFVSFTIYGIQGSEIITLLNEQLKPGTYEVEWDAANYPSGVYFYNLTAGDYSETKKMMLIK